VGLRAGLYLCEKISPPPGCDPRTVLQLSSRYKDDAILANSAVRYELKCKSNPDGVSLFTARYDLVFNP